jgi:hypothetical protein
MFVVIVGFVDICWVTGIVVFVDICWFVGIVGFVDVFTCVVRFFWQNLVTPQQIIPMHTF